MPHRLPDLYDEIATDFHALCEKLATGVQFARDQPAEAAFVRGIRKNIPIWVALENHVNGKDPWTPSVTVTMAVESDCICCVAEAEVQTMEFENLAVAFRILALTSKAHRQHITQYGRFTSFDSSPQISEPVTFPLPEGRTIATEMIRLRGVTSDVREFATEWLNDDGVFGGSSKWARNMALCLILASCVDTDSSNRMVDCWERLTNNIVKAITTNRKELARHCAINRSNADNLRKTISSEPYLSFTTRQ